MKEQQIQTKIIEYLKIASVIPIKTVITGTAGTPDIIACSPTGRFIAIEVKSIKGRSTKLQEYKLNQYINAKAIAFIAYGWDDFIVKWTTYYTDNINCPLIGKPNEVYDL